MAISFDTHTIALARHFQQDSNQGVDEERHVTYFEHDWNLSRSECLRKEEEDICIAKDTHSCSTGINPTYPQPPR